MVIGSLVVLPVAGAGGLFGLALLSPDRGSGVHTDTVARREIVQTITASGEVDAKTRVHVSSHVIGRIERLYVREGQTVKAGQALLDLEKDAFLTLRDRSRGELDIARLRLRQTEIDLAEAEARARRLRRLGEAGLVAEELLETAELRLESARVGREQAARRLEQAEIDLAKAEDDLAKTTIYSPIDGTLVALHAKEGEVVVSGTLNNPASVIGTLCDLSEMVVEVGVDETEIVDVAPGQPAEVVADALPNRKLQGSVVEIGNAGYHLPARPEITYFKTRIAFDEPVPELRPGMSVRATIEVASATEVPAVPLEAVGSWGGGDGPADGEPEAAGPAAEPTADRTSYVLVVVDGRARRRAVEAGIADETHVEVISGLGDGEVVVTGPLRVLNSLEDGDPVRVLDGGEEAGG